MIELKPWLVADACDKVQRRTIFADGCSHSSIRLFDASMRAFDAKPAANFMSFRVFWGSPVMKEGTATIWRDGRLECQVGAIAE